MAGAGGAAPGRPRPPSLRSSRLGARARAALAGAERAIGRIPLLRRLWASQGRLWARLGLRARLTLMFGLGALLLSVLMGGLSYFTARHVLVQERQSTTLHQAYDNAAGVRDELVGQRCPGLDVGKVFSQLDNSDGSAAVLFACGQWFESSQSVGEGAIPPALLRTVSGGTPATQTFDLGSTPEMAVGIPLPAVSATYYNLFDVSDLAHILDVLALVLVAAGLVTTVLGAAVGRSAATRALRPLGNVSRAATAIAGGQLDTRVPEAPDDPDLADLTRSFNTMIGQLQERIEREARFTSDVSHELRSPLTTLSASLDVLEAHRAELSERGRQALDLLAPDLRRFQRMVGELLEISRSDTGSADVSLEEVAAPELVRQSVAASVRTLGARVPSGDGPAANGAPSVVVDPAVAGTRLLVDKRRFERIMANLLENAALYGGGATRVAIGPGEVRLDGRPTVRIEVDDRGPGVAAGERARVFERFYRGQTSGRRGTGTGTGLGLALVAEHARLNGGAVWVEDADGGGARFVVVLPVADQEDDE